MIFVIKFVPVIVPVFLKMNKESKPDKPKSKPPKVREYFNPDAYEDWITSKRKKPAYVPKGRKAPEAINIIR